MFCSIESNILQQVHADKCFNEHIYKEMQLIIENKVFTMVAKKLYDFGMIICDVLKEMTLVMKFLKN